VDLRQEIQNLARQLAVSNRHHDKAREDDKRLYDQDLANQPAASDLRHDEQIAASNLRHNEQIAASNMRHDEQIAASNLRHDEARNELAKMRAELSFLRSFVHPARIPLTFFSSQII
jgi:hypothetical protein